MNSAPPTPLAWPQALLGYVYSTLRISVPELVREQRQHGPARVLLESLEGTAWELDRRGKPLPILDKGGGAPARKLYEGPVSVGAASGCGWWTGTPRSPPDPARVTTAA